MGVQSITERIISDAENSAEAIIAEAKRAAEKISDDRKTENERNILGTQAEVAAKVKAIKDGVAASARLDSAKVLLAEKRRVIDAVYTLALEKLLALDKKQTLALARKLLERYAENGDEIVFAADFNCKQEVAKLDIVKEKSLKVSAKTGDICGGFILCGKNSDKNLSYSALLASDRNEYEAQIARKLFATEKKD